MPGKKGSKKRPSRQFNNGVGDRVVQTGRYGRTAKRTQLGRTNLNDYAGQETAFVEAKNQNDYEGLNENDFIRNTNNNDYEGVIQPTNLNDYEGLNDNDFIENTNLNDYDDLGPNTAYGFAKNDSRRVRQGSALKYNQYYPFEDENVLHNFASYNTLFTLSGITQGELDSQSYLKNPVHDVVARSSGIGGDATYSTFKISEPTGNPNEQRQREATKKEIDESVEILKRGHDIFFENVNIISTTSPSPERSLADFSKMEFKMVEPFSITLTEKIRAATQLNGFDDYQDAPLLLTIEFKGFDENGKEYKGFGTIRKIPILISRVEFDVTEGGATYDVIAVRYQDMAFDDRYKFPRTTLKLQGRTPKGIMRKVSEQLYDSQVAERDEHNAREYIDQYVFEMDPAVEKFAKEFRSEVTSQHGILAKVKNFAAGILDSVRTSEDDDIDIGLSPDDELNATTSSQRRRERRLPERELPDAVYGDGSGLHSLVKIFEDVLRQAKGYKDITEDFWTTYLRRANVIGEDEEIKTQDELKAQLGAPGFEQTVVDNQYIDWFKIKTSIQTDTSKLDRITKMHRKTITFRAVPYKVHVLKLVKPGMSLKTDQSKKIARRVYNYIYTGENTDVQNLRIFYKAAFYKRNVYEPEKPNSGIFPLLKDKIKNVLFGLEKQPEKRLPLRQYPSTLKGKSLLETADGDDTKSQEFFDYLTNPQEDMMRVELQILGDPAFICQDQFIPASRRPSARSDFDKTTGSFRADSAAPKIMINYRLPTDPREDKGLTFSDSNPTYDGNLFFSGVYEVTRIESNIDQGQFLQTLTCVRLNNQDGEGIPPVLVKAANKKLLKTVEPTKEDSPLASRRWENYDNGKVELKGTGATQGDPDDLNAVNVNDAGP